MTNSAPPISVVRLKAEDYSPDGKCVIISLTTKYSRAERKYSVPIECLYDFIVDLQRLKAIANDLSTNTSITTDVPVTNNDRTPSLNLPRVRTSTD